MEDGDGFGFPCPTTIQKYAWLCQLKRVDFIGVSPAGSGKTLAYLVPALVSAKVAEVGRPRDEEIIQDSLALLIGIGRGLVSIRRLKASASMLLWEVRAEKF